MKAKNVDFQKIFKTLIIKSEYCNTGKNQLYIQVSFVVT